MVDRTIADAYALMWVTSVVMLGVTIFYGILGYWHVFGLSFHPEFLVLIPFWIFIALCMRSLFFRELSKEADKRAKGENVESR